MNGPRTEVGSRRRRGRWVPGLIALGALIAIGFVFGAGGDISHPAPRTLSGNDVSNQLAVDIQAVKSMPSPPAVSCPASEPVRSGFKFRCYTGDRPIYVIEIDGRGHLRWSLTPQRPAG